MSDLFTHDLEKVKLLKQRSKMLTDWLVTTGIPFDEALPILAVTVGTILEQQVRHVPKDIRQAHLNEGIEIAHAMMVAAALFGESEQP